MLNHLLTVQVGQLLLLTSYGQNSVVKVEQTTAFYVLVDAWPGVKFKKTNGWPVLSSRLKKQRLRMITGAELQGEVLTSLYQRLNEHHKLNVKAEDRLQLIELYLYLQERCLF